jgi:hypothetical protein
VADIPRLRDAIVAVLADSLSAAPDRWARAELPSEWPVPDAVHDLIETHQLARVGVLRPFNVANFDGSGYLVSVNAQEITERWRNTPIEHRRDKPTLILGDARGPDEAGLRELPRVVRDLAVLERWRSALREWLASLVTSTAPAELIDALLRFAEDGRVDAIRLEQFLEAAVGAEDLLDGLRSGLWILNLIPDSRVLDDPAGRLDTNLQVRRLLLAASEMGSDTNRIQRLRNAARDGNDAAAAAVHYRDDRDREHLRGTNLDALVQIMSPTGKATGSVKTLELFRLLDVPAGARVEDIHDALRSLAEDWDLSSEDEKSTIRATLTRPEMPDAEVAVDVNRPRLSESRWIGDGAADSQMLAFLVDADAPRDWTDVPAAAGLPVARLVAQAKAVDGLLGGNDFEGHAVEYLASRAALAPYEPWLRSETALVLLLLHEKARKAAREFLQAWKALAEALLREQGVAASPVRKMLILAEAVWGKAQAGSSGTYDWCVLGPFHPYALEPLVDLADYAHEHLGTPGLGSRLRWGVGQSIPAYQALWADQDSFFVSRADAVFEFTKRPREYRVPSTGGDGLTTIAASFLGFHPYADDALVITLVDPPRGGAIPANLRRITEMTKKLQVFVVATTGDTAQLEDEVDNVRFLGRFESLEDWSKRAPVRSHLMVVFASHPPGSIGPAGMGPTPGAHVAPQIRFDSGSPFEQTDELETLVAFDPRDNSGSVILLQRLAAPDLGSPRAFQVKPMLGDDEVRAFVAVSALSEWVVLGVPSPLGLVAPREPGAGITYLGREAISGYGLFVYGTSLFAIRRLVTQQIKSLPLLPTPDEVEQRIARLALESANGVLRIGSTDGVALWEHLGLMSAVAYSRGSPP